jgi:hypothetical protein
VPGGPTGWIPSAVTGAEPRGESAADRVDAVLGQEALGRRVEVRLGDEHLHRRAGAGGEMLAERDLAVAGGGVGEHELGLRDPGGLQLGQSEAAGGEDERGEHPHRAGSAAHRRGDLPPGAVRGEGGGLGGLRVVAGTARPERDAPAQQQHRGQEGQRRRHRDEDPDRGDRAEGAVGLQVRQQQAQQPCDHRAAGGEHRLERPAQRDPRRLRPAPGAAQLVAVAGDVQQRVVGRRADHEDEEDALGLARQQQHPGLGEVPDQQQRDAEGEHRGGQHDQRQQRGAVDEHEDDQHRGERDPEQEPVDAREGVAEVGGEARGAGDVGGEAVRQLRGEGVLDLVGDLAQVRVGVDGDEGLHGQAVLRGERRGRLVSDPVQRRERVDPRGDLLAGRRVDLLRGGDHDDRRDRVGAGELRGEAGDLGGLGGLREVRGLVVRGDLVDAAEVGPADRGAGEPHQDQQRRQQGAQRAGAAPRRPTVGGARPGRRCGAARHGVPPSVR